VKNPVDQLPNVRRFGGLNHLSVDVALQRIELDYDAQIDSENWTDIKAKFAGTCYLKVATEIPVRFNDNLIDLFEERFDSGGKVVENRKGWTVVTTETNTLVISAPSHPTPTLRHFILASRSVSLEWICTSVTVTMRQRSS
jgi:hypothetical protein